MPSFPVRPYLPRQPAMPGRAAFPQASSGAPGNAQRSESALPGKVYPAAVNACARPPPTTNGSTSPPRRIGLPPSAVLVPRHGVQPPQSLRPDTFRRYPTPRLFALPLRACRTSEQHIRLPAPSRRFSFNLNMFRRPSRFMPPGMGSPHIRQPTPLYASARPAGRTCLRAAERRRKSEALVRRKISHALRRPPNIFHHYVENIPVPPALMVWYQNGLYKIY